MTPKKRKTVIAICIQEPSEDGSSMDFGLIKGDDLRFLHQAFITDTISHSFAIDDADVRLYYMNSPGRKHLVKIVADYLKKKSSGRTSKALKDRFSEIELPKDRWGVRIEGVFRDCFVSGYDRVLLIGSRTPTFSSEMMRAALQMLAESDAVFGPTPEGRYYMIGMSKKYHIELSSFDWKSPKIYSEVVSAFDKEALVWSELEIWYSVDTPEDLEIMVRDINQFRFANDEATAVETEKVMERILARMDL